MKLNSYVHGVFVNFIGKCKRSVNHCPLGYETGPDDDNSIFRDFEFALEYNPNFNLFRRLLLFFEDEKPYRNHDISIKNIARGTFTNKTYVSTVVNTFMNMNFNQFVNFYRIKEACEIIESGSHIPMTLLCENVGFRSFSAFSSAFKNFTGYTPLNWQKRVDSKRLRRLIDNIKNGKDGIFK